LRAYKCCGNWIDSDATCLMLQGFIIQNSVCSDVQLYHGTYSYVSDDVEL